MSRSTPDTNPNQIILANKLMGTLHARPSVSLASQTQPHASNCTRRCYEYLIFFYAAHQDDSDTKPCNKDRLRCHASKDCTLYTFAAGLSVSASKSAHALKLSSADLGSKR
eukprot:s977_g6.t1